MQDSGTVRESPRLEGRGGSERRRLGLWGGVLPVTKIGGKTLKICGAWRSLQSIQAVLPGDSP